MTSYHHQLAAVMFTDVVGYTALMGRDEEKGLALLQKNREIHKSLIKKYEGHWIKEMGDGMLAQFDSAYNAARCAIEIQKKSKKELNGKLRIGLHIGEIIVENDDIFGDGVNIASRIESLAEPGSIYYSEAFFKALHNKIDIQSKYLGEVYLKNVDEPVTIYCIINEDLAIPTRQRIKQLRKGQTQEKLTFRKFFKQPAFYILIIILVAGLFTIRNLKEVKRTRTVQAIAVLPFSNFTGSDEEQYFVDMMQDAVITEIAKIGNFIVKSRTSTLQFRGTNFAIPQIAKMLDVDAIIESSVFKTGDSVYLNVQLIKTRPVEGHIWAEDYKRDTRHILSLYGELAKTVAKEVNVQLTPVEEKRLTEKKEVDPEAYKAYLNGQFHWNKLSKAGMDSAEYYYTISKTIDPNFALAYAGMASVSLIRAQFGLIPYHEAAIENIKFLDKALALDSTESQAHFLLAAFKGWGTWDYTAAEKEFIKSIDLSPNYAMPQVYYAHLLCELQRYDEARYHADFAIQLDPYNDLIKIVYAQGLNFMRRPDIAIPILSEIRQRDPYNGFMLSTIRTSYHITGEFEKAIEAWKDSYISDSLAYSELDNGYKKDGYQFALEKLGELMVKRSETEFVTPWRICTIYTRAGNKEEAIDWLEKAFIAHDQNMPYITTDPIFDFLRDDSRFQAIVKKMNLKI